MDDDNLLSPIHKRLEPDKIKPKKQIYNHRHRVNYIIKYNNVSDWVAIHKCMPSKSSKNKTEKILGTWCYWQKWLYRNRQLDDDKFDLLNKIDGWCWEQIPYFHVHFQKVKNLMESENISLINENKKLDNWCKRQKRAKRLNKLDSGKISMLESIKGWSWMD